MNIFISMALGLNIIFACYFWKCAQIDFKNKNNALGWIDIFFSAANAAAALFIIL
jgi:ABC-type sulfate transport system permease subunit